MPRGAAGVTHQTDRQWAPRWPPRPSPRARALAYARAAQAQLKLAMKSTLAQGRAHMRSMGRVGSSEGRSQGECTTGVGTAPAKGSKGACAPRSLHSAIASRRTCPHQTRQNVAARGRAARRLCAGPVTGCNVHTTASRTRRDSRRPACRPGGRPQGHSGVPSLAAAVPGGGARGAGGGQARSFTPCRRQTACQRRQRST